MAPPLLSSRSHGRREASSNTAICGRGATTGVKAGHRSRRRELLSERGKRLVFALLGFPDVRSGAGVTPAVERGSWRSRPSDTSSEERRPEPPSTSTRSLRKSASGTPAMTTWPSWDASQNSSPHQRSRGEPDARERARPVRRAAAGRPTAEKLHGVPPSTQHMELDRRGAELLFQVLKNARRNQRSRSPPTNRSPVAPKPSPTPGSAQRFVDRLTFNGHILPTGTPATASPRTRRQDQDRQLNRRKSGRWPTSTSTPTTSPNWPRPSPSSRTGYTSPIPLSPRRSPRSSPTRPTPPPIYERPATHGVPARRQRWTPPPRHQRLTQTRATPGSQVLDPV